MTKKMVYMNRHKDQNTIINYNRYFKLGDILFIEALLTLYIILLIDNTSDELEHEP